MNYEEFLNLKTQLGTMDGFEPIWIPDFLKPFQKYMVDWAIRIGRGALIEDCGLGKTPQELVWAENVVRHTNKPVLIATPLAVAGQTIREAEKFGIEAYLSRDGLVKKNITVTNYDQIHKFNPSDFGGMVCGESSILKNFDGSLRNLITEFMRKMRFRLLETATAAPNDYIELGTSSEALGYLGFIDMLNMFFKNEQNNTSTKRLYGEAPKWRFKGHAEERFWRWVCSWARAIRKPGDIGFDGSEFVLPQLTEEFHMVDIHEAPEGFLFTLPAMNLREQRDERKRTIRERCEMAASLVVDTNRPAFLGCHLNDEGDLLESMIPGSVQVSGKDSDDSKEEKILSFAAGQVRALITKPKIGAWGLNFQHCAHVVYFPSHSYEQYYQLIRRCWRFGQKYPVKVDVILTEGERKSYGESAPEIRGGR